uniref:Uncharacterized protein n=1 Tax=Strigamia maritima TaxID=126957 RepID=T1JML2_STRMM
MNLKTQRLPIYSISPLIDSGHWLQADFTNLEDYIEYIWMSGHGLAQAVPPASGNASEFVIDTWEQTEHSGNPIDDSEHASGSGEFMTSWLGSGPTSQHDSGTFLQRENGSTSQMPSGANSQREILLQEHQINELPVHRESRQSQGMGYESVSDRMPRRSSAFGEKRYKSKDRTRPSKSHSPVRRISEHISTAVQRLASLFQAVPKTKYVVTFPELVAPVPGQYCLLYLSHGVDNIHGMSDPFEIRAVPEIKN